MKFRKIQKLGQNFLKNTYFLRKIAENLEIKKDDIVIEIGGGHGELTKFLLNAKKLIVYEIDKKLAEILKNKFSDYQNVEIINQNFLLTDLEKFDHQYKLVGNIPYRITGLIFRKVLNLKNYPQIFVLTLQKEVGEKILKESFLSNWIKVWGEVKKIGIIKKENFYPKPKVDSMILKINFYQKPLFEKPENFAKFLKILFKQPKKKVKNNLKIYNEKLEFLNKEILEKRPHQLKFEEIKRIYEILFGNNK